MQRSILVCLLSLFALFATAQSFNKEQAKIDTLISLWLQAHNHPTKEAFTNLYADQVQFYGEKRSADLCAQLKLVNLERYRDFELSLDGPIDYFTYDSGVVLCKFIKGMSLRHKYLEFNSYLVLKQTGDHYKIIAETDKATRSTKAITHELGKEIPHETFAAQASLFARPSTTSDKTPFWLIPTLIIVGAAVYRRGKKKAAAQSKK